MTESKDAYLKILAYRSTRLKNAYSPGELLMCGRLRTKLPLSSTKKFEEQYRKCQRKDFDRRHGVRDLPELFYGDNVWLTDLKCKAKVQAPADDPRSYWVNTDTDAVRRNRTQLVCYSPAKTNAESVCISDGVADARSCFQDTSHMPTRRGGAWRCLLQRNSLAL
ncbi:uncharacterized protein [Dermacentor albipictus]|uniref:uncharacterized protein n=1 Tax=Dermacentor albipictus TaxID=60249 RepID=UPI0038FC92C0